MEQEGGDDSPGLHLFPTWPNVVIDDDNQTFELPYEMRFNDGNVVTIVFYSILMVVSAIGNITVLSIILKRRRTSTSRINTMLIHLAIADLMVTFLMMPLEIIWATTVAWRAGDTACRITAFFRIFGLYLSSFILICISIDRYFAVLKPMNLSDVDRRGKVMLTCAWVSSILCSFPQILVFHVETHPRLHWFEQCVTFHVFQTQTQALAYYFFCMFMMYALPLLVIIFSYASILTEIYRRSREPLNDRFRRSSLGFLGRARSRTLKMTITIVVVFFVCWTPYYVMCVWHWIFPESAKAVDLRIQKALFLFACTNSCMNPIVYGAYNIRTRRRDPGQRNHTQESIHGAVDVVRLVTWRRTGSTPAPGSAMRDYCLSCRARQNNGCVVLLRTADGVKVLSAQ